MAWDEADPCGDLAAVVEFVCTAKTGEQGTGGGRTDAGELHQPFATRVFTGCVSDGAVVFGNQPVKPVGVRQEIADTPVGVTRQIFQMRADLSTQASDLLWQDDAEFRDQAAQSVVDRRALFNKALPGAVQAENDLLVCTRAEN